MNYRKLGNTGIEISEISFGCMSLGDNQQENERLIHHSIDQGINFFDTADLYQHGFNEESVGKAIKSKRNEITLCTKAGNVWNADGKTWHWDASRKHILQAVEASLTRLQTDHIDLYLLHGGTIEDPIDETIEAFELLKEQGKIKHYGISSIRPNVIRQYVERSNIVSIMMQYSLLDRRPEESMLELLHANQISVLARGSLAKGLLAGKPPAAYLDHETEDVKKMQASMMKMIQSPEHLPWVALQFALHRPAIASAVVGIRTMEQLEQLLSFNPETSDKDLDKLRNVLPVNVYSNHR